MEDIDRIWELKPGRVRRQSAHRGSTFEPALRPLGSPAYAPQPTDNHPMPTSTPIDPQHVLIVGAGPGLSASIAPRFGREEFAVTIIARREPALSKLARELRGAGVAVDT